LFFRGRRKTQGGEEIIFLGLLSKEFRFVWLKLKEVVRQTIGNYPKTTEPFPA
jgi:hypothetical protein